MNSFIDKSAPKKISGGKKASNIRKDSEADPELWTGVLMGLLVTVLFLAFLIGFLVTLQAKRARNQNYNQETSLATLTGENSHSKNLPSSKENSRHGDNLNKLSSENSDITQSTKHRKNIMSSSTLSQAQLSCASPTDPDVVQLHLPAAGTLETFKFIGYIVIFYLPRLLVKYNNLKCLFQAIQ